MRGTIPSPDEVFRKRMLSTYHARIANSMQCLREEREAEGWLEDQAEVEKGGNELTEGIRKEEVQPCKARKVCLEEGGGSTGLSRVEEAQMEEEEEEQKETRRRNIAKRKQYLRVCEIRQKKQKHLAEMRSKNIYDQTGFASHEYWRRVKREVGLGPGDSFHGILLPIESSEPKVGRVDMTCSEEVYDPGKDLPVDGAESKILPQASSSVHVPAQSPKGDVVTTMPQKPKDLTLDGSIKVQESIAVSPKAKSSKPNQFPIINSVSYVKKDGMGRSQFQRPRKNTVDDDKTHKWPMSGYERESRFGASSVRTEVPISVQKTDWPAPALGPGFGTNAGMPVKNTVTDPDIAKQPFPMVEETKHSQNPNPTGFAPFKFGGGQLEPLKPINERPKRFLDVHLPTSQMGQPAPNLADPLFSNSALGKPADVSHRRIARVKRKGNNNQTQGGKCNNIRRTLVFLYICN